MLIRLERRVVATVGRMVPFNEIEFYLWEDLRTISADIAVGIHEFSEFEVNY